MTIAAAALLAPGAISLWPLDGLQAAGGQLFQPSPRLDGSSVASCGGLSPLTNACVASVPSTACANSVCAPNVRGGLAYTGTVTASVAGKDRWSQPVYVSWTCSYIASTQANVWGIGAGGCWGSSNAPFECNTEPGTGEELCGNWMFPPFRLTGAATPPPPGAAPPLGSWSVEVTRG